jgi:23S rRNA pseudouridine1911/1915/1917 synthase
MTETDQTPAAAGRHEVRVEAAEGGTRVDRLLAARLAGLSRSRIKALIEAGALSADGATINEPSLRVKPGQTFAIVIPETRDAEPEAQAIALDILYEDSDIVVVNKPAGLVVHPAPGNPDRTLVNALIAHCGASLQGIGGVRRPGIVHRLDKDTSGVMVVAKTEVAHHGLTEQFARRDIARRYLALVWGRPAPPQGEITGNIGRSPRNRKKMAVVQRGGKTALTRYRLRASYGDGSVSLLECRLQTGRTHQIRVHLAHKGHPLIGDPLYGRSRASLLNRLPAPQRERVRGLTRQALHAQSLGFHHPRSAEWLEFTTELPPDLNGLKHSLELL